MKEERQNKFGMIDVGGKSETSRRAVAKGKIRVGKKAFELIKAKRLPKGDVLALAEAAGIMAAKRTSELLPLCHPLGLDSVSLSFALYGEEYAVEACCEAKARAKTGVEMEALSGVSGALLCVYDLVKGVTPALSITEIHLEIKEGGKSGRWLHPEYIESKASLGNLPCLDGVSVAVITISDRASCGETEDLSGPLLKDLLEGAGAEIVSCEIVADELNDIVKIIHEVIEEHGARVVVTTGGTGLGPRDVTPEAVSLVCDRTIPGIAELLRTRGLSHTPFAVLSRTLAGVCGEAFVVALPGSPKAVRQGMEELLDLIPHALAMMRGEGHEKEK